MKSIASRKSDFFVSDELVGVLRRFALQKEKTEFELLERDSGAQEGNYMKRKERDHNEPHGRLTPIPDFLPPPEELVPREEAIKITVAINTKTLKFFKEYAKKSGLKYQRIIREVLKGYARRYG